MTLWFKNSMVLKLSDQTPIAQGGERLIFIHPENDDWLIKVWHERFHEKQQKRTPFLIRVIRMKRYWSLLNELTEYLGVREEPAPKLEHLQELVGLTDTDLGFGMVVKAIKQDDGTLAPTLKDLVERHKFHKPHNQALETFFEWMSTTHIIVRDFSLNNLIWDEGNERFILIDGIGSKIGFSLRSLSRRYNQKANLNRIAKFRTRLAKALAS